ncbi:hypothetical protein [Streptomyces coffeae]|nr:hypothetical protein [Streptomyces coffeae]
MTWSAEWQCHVCGASGVTQFDDDTTTFSGRECEDEVLEMDGATA